MTRIATTSGTMMKARPTIALGVSCQMNSESRAIAHVAAAAIRPAAETGPICHGAGREFWERMTAVELEVL
jgi:hypothetical protein